MNQDEILSIVKDAYVVVWQYRGELEHVWPTPPPEDCRWFAYTEAGEAIDAMLRNNLKYRRNNTKKLDEKDEWADCLIMLLSSIEDIENAMDAHFPLWSLTTTPLRKQIIDGINASIIDACDGDTFDACMSIAYLLGDDTVSRVRGRLEAIKNKQLSPADDRLYSSTDDTQPWVIPSGTTKTVL